MDTTTHRVEAAMAAVPRSHYIPDRAWDRGQPIDRSTDPERWQALVDADDAVVTQVDQGAPDGPGLATSSSSAPSVMARMLDALDVAEGMRVLEIGTGTGYNAALLAHLVGGEGHVDTVEVDEEVAAGARGRLAEAGLSNVAVHHGDGAAGHPDGGAYDRVIATCAVSRIPQAWISQAPGGVIVAPWTPHPRQPGGLLARLQVRGNTASGRFAGDLAFMSIRGAGAPEPAATGLNLEPDTAETVTTDPWELLSPDSVWPLWITVPGWIYGMRRDDDLPWVMWIASTHEYGWARISPASEGYLAEQGGHRRVWDELTAAWQWWHHHGTPDSTEFGLTVAPHGEHRTWFAPNGPTWTH
ncbi:methyltransferase domain-containing protein [Salinactinospora qingdaonensis]